jgi:NADH-quinone oxidoreductase subunit D
VEPLAEGVMDPQPTIGTPSRQGFTKRVFDWGEDLHEDLLTLNMGPQHPSTHGVLRIVLTLDGEVIVHAEPVVGYLHRAKEKMAENLTYLQFLPHTDRLDYLAPQINNVAMCLAVEKLCGLTVPPRGAAIRVVVSELMRIMSHLIYLGTTALDIGAATVFFHAFREREQIYDIIDRITGQRMNNSFIRVGGVGNDIDGVAIAAVRDFTKSFPARVDEYEKLLTKNRIWWERNRDIGVITKEQALALSLTGPILRACGVEHDLRRTQPYLGYENYDFEIPVGGVGDCYDRYLVRIEEMRQSNRILEQAVAQLPPGEIYVEDRRYVMPPKERVLDSMEELIYQFKVVTDMRVPAGEVYSALEAAKGELGFYVVSRGDSKAHRLHVRSPSFINLQALAPLARGRYVSDLVAIIGSLDFVMGEVDR